MTHLRQAMLEELHRRNYATTTVQYYIQAVERFAKHFHRPPDQLNQTHLCKYQAYVLRDRKLEPRTVKLRVSARRFSWRSRTMDASSSRTSHVSPAIRVAVKNESALDHADLPNSDDLAAGARAA